MDGNAALWLQAYKRRHEVVAWPDFIAAVEAKFGVAHSFILVDSGSSHSFIKDAMLSCLNCKVQPLPPATFRVANGETLTCDRIVPELSWWIDGHTL